MKNYFILRSFFCLLLVLGLNACQDEGESVSPDNSSNGAIDTGVVATTSCDNPTDQIFVEEGGILIIEAENTEIKGEWSLQNSIEGYAGQGYIVWTGEDLFGKPGQGLHNYKIRISTPGTYRIQIRSYNTIGESGSENNDVWLRLPDADDFYGQKNNSIVYPKDSGKTPNPKGAGKDGWFKAYMNQRGQWSLRTSTSDHDAHDIYARFDAIGDYKLQLSGRSHGFGIDRVILYHETADEEQATNASTSQSGVSCQ